MFPDQVNDITGWPNEGGVTDRIEGEHDLVQLLRDRVSAASMSAILAEKRLIAKGKFAQELVHVCQLTIVFVEHRRNVHDLPGDDQLGDDVNGDLEPRGKGLDIAQHVIGQAEHDGRLSHPIYSPLAFSASMMSLCVADNICSWRSNETRKIFVSTSSSR